MRSSWQLRPPPPTHLARDARSWNSGSRPFSKYPCSHTGVRQSNPTHPGVHRHMSGATQSPPLAHTYTPCATDARLTSASCRSLDAAAVAAQGPVLASHGYGTSGATRA